MGEDRRFTHESGGKAGGEEARPCQVPAPYAAHQTEDWTTTISGLFTAIMPLIVVMMQFKMLVPLIEDMQNVVSLPPQKRRLKTKKMRSLLLRDLRGPVPREHVIKVRKELRSLLPAQSKRDRFILIGRWGLQGEAIRTLASLGEEVGIVRERVRQIEQRTVRLLLGRTGLNKEDLFAALEEIRTARRPSLLSRMRALLRHVWKRGKA